MRFQSGIHLLPYEEKAHREWNRFVQDNPRSTPFHLLEFGAAFSLTYGYEKYYLTAVNNNKIAGIFPIILIKSRLFGNRLLSLPFCEYGGTLVDPNSSNPENVASSLIKVLLKFAYRSKGVSSVEIRSPLLYCELLRKAGFRSARRYMTFRINLACQKEDLWNALDKKTRNSVRKAIRNDLTIQSVSSEDDLEKYFPLYLKTQKKHGSPPHSHELFRNLFKLNMRRSIRVSIAEVGGRPIAGVIVFYNKRDIYWWAGSSDPTFRSLNATDLLLWETIEWGQRRGYNSLYLGRTRYGTGVYHFKKGWGGTEVPLTDYLYPIGSEYTSTPDPNEGQYRLLSTLWSLLPTVLSESIGPGIAKQIGL